MLHEKNSCLNDFGIYRIKHSRLIFRKKCGEPSSCKGLMLIKGWMDFNQTENEPDSSLWWECEFNPRHREYLTEVEETIFDLYEEQFNKDNDKYTKTKKLTSKDLNKNYFSG
jgi:hypothetical protein